jgi:1-aminocyclopropane-1-carboxylate deaminase
MVIELQPANIQYMQHVQLERHGLQLGILRLDALHSVISGNKWYKLQAHITAAQLAGKNTLLSFGGAYSNHLVATAAAAQQMGLGSIGMVRGLHAAQHWTDTLKDCAAYGMQLQFLSREQYDCKCEPEYVAELRAIYPDVFIIPEGGNSVYGLSGAGRIAQYIPANASVVACALGTGTTFAGIRQQLPPHIAMLGFPVMKGGNYLASELRNKTQVTNWELNDSYHCGGFGRHTPELIGFMNRFYEMHGVALDFVYTAKMMLGIFDLIDQGHFAPGSHIVCVHTGGLQGNRSIASQLVWPLA